MFPFFCRLVIGVWQFSRALTKRTCAGRCCICSNSQEWKRTPIINTKHDQMKLNKELKQRQIRLVNVVAVCISLTLALAFNQRDRFCVCICVCTLHSLLFHTAKAILLVRMALAVHILIHENTHFECFSY